MYISWSAVIFIILLGIMSFIIPLRVTAQEEHQGLDKSTIGIEAYESELMI